MKTGALLDASCACVDAGDALTAAPPVLIQPTSSAPGAGQLPFSFSPVGVCVRVLGFVFVHAISLEDTFFVESFDPSLFFLMEIKCMRAPRKTGSLQLQEESISYRIPHCIRTRGASERHSLGASRKHRFIVSKANIGFVLPCMWDPYK